METDRAPVSIKEDSAWPTWKMLSNGTFGEQDQAGRLYHRRGRIAIIVFLLWEILVSALYSPGNQRRFQMAILILPAGMGYNAWALRRYLFSLDELARRIQFEAMAWTYLMALVAISALAALAIIIGWQLNPWWLVWLLGLEYVRGAVLYKVSRRY